MKFLKRFFIGLILFLGISIVLLYIFDYEYILKGIKTTYFTGHTTAFIEDYSHFENRKIEASITSQPWPLAEDYNKAEATPELKKLNKDRETVAFLIIKNDSIWYEKYFDEFNKDSKSNSFSMAKS
ncbi:MAG TPA: serine hydrolase, partial [Salinimicrobium sp.]|nr:serine hydrolase [Salinimicrobium sp.]